MFKYVLANSTKHDGTSILKAIDEFCWNGHWMNHTGDRKGKILDKAIKESKPKKALEIGTYLGYGTIRIARLMEKGSRLVSIDVNKKWQQLASKVIKYAGVDDIVTLKSGKLIDHIDWLINTMEYFDFIFLDHNVESFLEDMKMLEIRGCLKHGTTVVVDKILWPGSPDMRLYL